MPSPCSRTTPHSLCVPGSQGPTATDPDPQPFPSGRPPSFAQARGRTRAEPAHRPMSRRRCLNWVLRLSKNLLMVYSSRLVARGAPLGRRLTDIFAGTAIFSPLLGKCSPRRNDGKGEAIGDSSRFGTRALRGHVLRVLGTRGSSNVHASTGIIVASSQFSAHLVAQSALFLRARLWMQWTEPSGWSARCSEGFPVERDRVGISRHNACVRS